MKRIIIIAALILLAAAGMWFGITKYQQSRITSATACTGPKLRDFACYQSFYQRKVQNAGVGEAFVDLKAGFKTNQFIVSNCHQLTHIIGRAASSKYPKVAEAYKHGDDFCSSGYYHGVMEGIVGRIGEKALATEANTICASFHDPSTQYSLVHHNCTHGMGHGFMAVEGDELFTSLGMCDYLTDSWEQSSCYGGVFMENHMADINKFHATKYLKPEEPMYPCTAVAARYQNSCYFNQTSYALRVLGQDFTKVFALCDAVPSEHRDSCYQSLGRDASGNVLSDLAATRQNCYYGTGYQARSNCIIGAVKDIIWHFNSTQQGEAFCNSLTADLQPICRTTGSEYYSTFKT